MIPKRIAVSVALLLAPLACENADEVSSLDPQSPHSISPGLIQGPYVQGGTVFSARLDGPIDTFYTPPGTPFTATVTAPIQGPDGRVIVPSGAKVHGMLASVGAGDIPLIRVQIRSIDTIAGTLPVRASVRAAEHYDWKGPPTLEPSASYVVSYGFLDYGSATSGTETGVPGRPVEGRALMQPREIHVPAGALMQLQVTEPLVLPGAQIAK